MKDLSYWIDKIKGQRKTDQPKEKLAEKILIGYESPKVRFKYVVMYRHVDKLQTYYPKPIYVDSTGFKVGILRERVYDDLETCISVIKDHLDSGWIFEQGEPVLLKKMDEAGVIYLNE